MIAIANALRPSTVPIWGSASVSGTTMKPATPASAHAAAKEPAWIRRTLMPIQERQTIADGDQPMDCAGRNASDSRVDGFQRTDNLTMAGQRQQRRHLWIAGSP
jgi:hypothetical protein